VPHLAGFRPANLQSLALRRSRQHQRQMQRQRLIRVPLRLPMAPPAWTPPPWAASRATPSTSSGCLGSGQRVRGLLRLAHEQQLHSLASLQESLRSR
jgi:hypothetical protein